MYFLKFEGWRKLIPAKHDFDLAVCESLYPRKFVPAKLSTNKVLGRSHNHKYLSTAWSTTLLRKINLQIAREKTYF